LKDIRILVVDDLPVVCELVVEQLSLAGMDVEAASCGKEALLMMERAANKGKPYHIALIDYLMPHMNGETLARAISDVPAIRDTCLIMMTAAGNPIVGDTTAKRGFSAYISKPLRHDQLVEILSYVWTQYQAGDRETLIRVDTLSFGKEAQAEDQLRLDGRLILLAEDSRINQAFAQEVLENMGARLIVVSNGKEALQALQSNPDINLVLMDCQMPVMDGFEATRHIMELKKKKKIPPSLPVIALTANAMEGDREKCIQAGMDDYISKPVRRKDLKKAVYRWLVENRNDGSYAHSETASVAESLLDSHARSESQAVFSDKYQTMLAYYREDGETYLAEIDNAIARKNIEDVIRPVHTLKSNSRGMGAARLSDMCRDMEIKARAMAENRLDTSWPELAHDLEALRECFILSCDALFKEHDQSSAREA
jgi:CheY-like chemotaxis protein